ncbi:MAG: glycine dehydrogenase [Desulfitibacter sp. BRH_c19]|nr:MAG: glycine dehydrogenase [Desulfitibacter sp. BRH_c19]
MRYSPNTSEDKKEMLASIGYEKIEELFQDIPEEIRKKANLDVGNGMSEHELKKHVGKIAARNETLDDLISFLGAGTYEHYIPSFVDQLLLRSEFYTAYTPYQPEISQGTLQAIFEYQSLICELTGMDGTNASVYDGANATAEAASMAVSATRRTKVLYSKGLHPEYVQTIKTYGWVQDLEVLGVEVENGTTSIEEVEKNLTKDVACIIVQYPNICGCVEDLQKIAKIAHAQKALLVVVNTEPVALGVLKTPGELGADIVAGEGQSFGNPVAFGGPHLGFIATAGKLIRRLPGRIVGKTKDVDGKIGFVLTLQAREQHIRREKASSNICSNQALCALAATMAMCAIGKEGLVEMAETNLQKAHYAYKKLTAIKGVEAVYPEKPFFNEFVVKTPVPAATVIASLSKQGILPGVDLGKFDASMANHLLVCVTELKTKDEIDLLAERLEGVV